MYFTTATLPLQMQHNIVDYSKAAVITLVLRKYPDLFSKEDIEDIAGNTSYKACKSISKYNTKWALSTWINKIAYNCILDAVDEKMKRMPISQHITWEDEDGDERDFISFSSYRGDEFEADRDITMEEFFNGLENCSCTLNTEEKKVYEMMCDGKKPLEIANELNCSANAATIRCYNVRKKIKPAVSELAKNFDINCKKLAS